MKHIILFLFLLTQPLFCEQEMNEASRFRRHRKDFFEMLQKEEGSASGRVRAAVKHLKIATDYLSKNTKPTETPELNVMPPGGSRAGIDPATIKNKEERLRYEEAIAANKALIDAHTAWDEASKLKDETALLIVAEIRHNPKVLTDNATQVMWLQLSESTRQSIQKQAME